MSEYDFEYQHIETYSREIVAEVAAYSRSNPADLCWINVVFTKHGFDKELTLSNNSGKSLEIFKRYPAKIKRIALIGLKTDFIHDVGELTQESIIREMLSALRHGLFKTVECYIIIARSLGYDYPEFKTIEKSIESTKLHESWEPGFHSVDDEGREIFIKYSDKNALIRYLLKRLRKNDYHDIGEILYRINDAKYHGYDYPEFDVIRKSFAKWDSDLNESQVHESVEKPEIHVHSIEHISNRDTLFEVEFNGHIMSVIIHNIGLRSASYEVITGDEESQQEWEKYGDKISLACMSGWVLDCPLDKEHILAKILKYVRAGAYEQAATAILLSKRAGYDFPEFKMIEKSIRSTLP